MIDRRDIEYVDLRLDETNPRHDPVRNQREAIAALLDTDADRRKVLNLAQHIVEHGPSPIDSILVMPEGGTFVVLEGNRRTAALKLLHNPDLAQDKTVAKRLRQLAAQADELPSVLAAVVVASRDEAREWQILRHAGEATGEGVVPWNPEARQRFHRRPGTHADRALMVADALEAAYSDDAELMELVGRVKKAKLTTLGRLVSDPHVRDRLGIDMVDGELVRHYPADQLKPALKSILQELDKDLTVSSLKTKEQRRKYIADKQSVLPDEQFFVASPEPFGPAQPATKPKPKVPRPVKPSLFGDLSLAHAHQRIQDLATELRRLNPETYPNACALLIRSVVELMVGEFLTAKNLTRDREVADRIKRCLDVIDPSGRDTRYQAVRIGLSDKNSPVSARTMNAWVHNVHLAPSASDLQTTTQNWTLFLQALDAELA